MDSPVRSFGWSQIASATIDGLNIQTALIVMGVIAVAYTSIGGLKAVIYIPTIQWLILIGGLVFIGIPVAYNAGGYDAIKATLDPKYLSMTNVTWYQIPNWSVTIIPWLFGMTPRIYASKGPKEAKKAWIIGPVMAFMDSWHVSQGSGDKRHV
jgi:SSS family solute:Na+ symporter